MQYTMDNQDTHLLQNFPEAEKIAYLSAIAIMAGSDGTVTEQEQAFLSALADRSDLSEQAEQQIMDAAHHPTDFIAATDAGNVPSRVHRGHP